MLKPQFPRKSLHLTILYRSSDSEGGPCRYGVSLIPTGASSGNPDKSFQCVSLWFMVNTPSLVSPVTADTQQDYPKASYHSFSEIPATGTNSKEYQMVVIRHLREICNGNINL